ncbi:MAG: hypothetical protein ACYC56_10505 [Candidatus Aquicultor sp.]
MSAKKDTGLNDALSFIMGTKAEAAPKEPKPENGHKKGIIEPQNGHKMAIKGPENAARRPGKERLVNHHIGFYPADWQALERMAAAEGGNVAVLIRRAVREMLARTSFRE